jgi:apolipoprotein N-acyltransferase
VQSPSHRPRDLAIALSAGAFLGLLGPPTNLYFAPWVALTVLAWLLPVEAPTRTNGASVWRRARGRLDGAGVGLAFGFGANLVLLRFVPAVIVRFTPLPFTAGIGAQVLLALLQAIAWPVAGVVAVQLSRLGVPRWVAFGIGVYAGTFVPAVFRWSPAGLLSPVAEMGQLAELVGERGVDLILALSAGLFATALRRWPRASHETSADSPDAPRSSVRASLLLMLAALGLPLLTYVEGKVRIARVERDRAASPALAIGLVQPSIDAVGRWDSSLGPAILARLTELTRSSESEGAELTIWPESAFPYPYSHVKRECPVAPRAILSTAVRGPVLTGFLMVGRGLQYNSAAICSSDGALTPPEDKIRLLAFGERIPVVGDIAWVRRVFVRGTGLSAGTHNVVQAWGPVRASVLICVEDTLAEGGREAMEDRPNLLVNLTNDAWFAGSQESELHLRLAILRSVESRRDMVRDVNLGPTTWVDAAGVVRARYDSPSAGVLQTKPALLEWSPTLFDRFGDVPTTLALVVTALAGAIRHRRKKDASLAPS